VWRRYVTAARSSGAVSVELRYEDLVADPDGAASLLAESLDTPRGPLVLRLRRAHGSSVGRHRRDLSDDQLAEVEDEAGDLLRELGYLS
jgi:hypothetical protein